MSPIHDYSTTVSVDKTVDQIIKVLRYHGAMAISLNYKNDEVDGISFLISTPFGPKEFLLPANVDKVYDVLGRQYNEGKIRSGFYTKAQARKVAWRIIKDWIQAQLAIVESEMVDMAEIMLPYMKVGDHTSLYQAMVDRRLSLEKGRV